MVAMNACHQRCVTVLGSASKPYNIAMAMAAIACITYRVYGIGCRVDCGDARAGMSSGLTRSGILRGDLRHSVGPTAAPACTAGRHVYTRCMWCMLASGIDRQ